MSDKDAKVIEPFTGREISMEEMRMSDQVLGVYDECDCYNNSMFMKWFESSDLPVHQISLIYKGWKAGFDFRSR